MISKFLQMLWSSPVVDEDAIARELYGAAADRSSNSYKQLRRRVIDEMGSEVLSIDLNSPAFTPWQRGYYGAHRDLAIAEVLRGRNVSAAAAFYHRRALKNAELFEATPVRLVATKALRYYSSVVERDAKAHRHYDEAHERAVEDLRTESDIHRLFSELILLEHVAAADRSELHQRAAIAADYLSQRYDISRLSQRYVHSYFVIQLMVWESIADHDNCLQIIEKALDYFENQAYPAPTPLAYFRASRMSVYMMLGRYREAQDDYRKALPLVKPFTPVGTLVYERSILLSLHQQQYAEAYNQYCQFTGQAGFHSLSERTRENWHVYRAYIHLLKLSGELSGQGLRDPLGEFRRGKFLNDVTKVAQEKRGRNIPVLVVDLLLALMSGNGTFWDQQSGLEKYLTRYLRPDTQYRSYCFVHILLELSRSNRRRSEFLSRSAGWRTKLTAAPLKSADQSIEIEVIPYEVLLDIVISRLR